MLSLMSCPERHCGAPAEVFDIVVLASTAGPVRHVRVRCVRRHLFLMPDRSDTGLHR